MLSIARNFIFCIGITTALIVSAAADQKLSGVNPHITQIKELSQDMQGLRLRLNNLRVERLQLINQIKALNDKINPLEARLKSDADQIRGLMRKS